MTGAQDNPEPKTGENNDVGSNLAHESGEIADELSSFDEFDELDELDENDDSDRSATAGCSNLDGNLDGGKGDSRQSHVTERTSRTGRKHDARNKETRTGSSAHEDGINGTKESKTSFEDQLKAQRQEARRHETRQQQTNSMLMEQMANMAKTLETLMMRVEQMPKGGPNGGKKPKKPVGITESHSEFDENDSKVSGDDLCTESNESAKVDKLEAKINNLERRSTIFIKENQETIKKNQVQRGVDETAARNNVEHPVIASGIAETITAPTLKSQEKGAIFAFQAKRSEYEAKVPVKLRIPLRGMMAPVMKRLFKLHRPDEIEGKWDEKWVHRAQISPEYLEAWLQLHQEQDDTEEELASRVNLLERDFVKIQANMRTANASDRVADLADKFEESEKKHLGIHPVTKRTRMHPSETRSQQFILLAMRPMQLGLELWKQVKSKSLKIDGKDAHERRKNLYKMLTERGRAMRKKDTGNPLVWNGTNDPNGKRRSKMQWKNEYTLSPLLSHVVGKDRALQLVTEYHKNKDKPPKQKPKANAQTSNTPNGGNDELASATLQVRQLKEENAKLKKKNKSKRPLSCWICGGVHYSNKCTHASATDEMKARPSSYYFNLINEAKERGETWKPQFKSE